MLLAIELTDGIFSPHEYYTPDLVGGSIEYDMYIGAKCKN